MKRSNALLPGGTSTLVHGTGTWYYQVPSNQLRGTRYLVPGSHNQVADDCELEKYRTGVQGTRPAEQSGNTIVLKEINQDSKHCSTNRRFVVLLLVSSLALSSCTHSISNTGNRLQR